MFEKMRERWTNAIHPLVVKMGDLDPSSLTWASLGLAILSFYLLSQATGDSTGSIWIIGGVFLILIAGVLDALDGALARHQGTDGPYGDFLDHTIDRVVDVGLLVAIGMNSTQSPIRGDGKLQSPRGCIEMSRASVAALLTLCGIHRWLPSSNSSQQD